MNETVVTETTFYPIVPTEKGMIGFSSCLLDGKISLNSISVYLTPTGDVRLLFPNKFLPNGREINIYYPINNEVYGAIRQAIADKLESVKKTVEEKSNARRKEQ